MIKTHCDPACPCQNPAAPTYPSGRIFKDRRNQSLLVIGKRGKFPAAKYTVLNISTGQKSEHSYPALVRKESGNKQ